MQDRITIATDGSCLGNPGPGGWAWVSEDGHTLGAGFEPDTTNNRMELTAVLRAIQDNPGELHIQSDSKYVVNIFTSWAERWKSKGWKNGRKPLMNLDLIQPIYELVSQRDITFEWVRGHNGHPLNEKADHIATTACQSGAQGYVEPMAIPRREMEIRRRIYN